MPQPTVSRSVNPSDPATILSGRSARPDDLTTIINSIKDRLDRIESALSSNAWQPFKFTSVWTNYSGGSPWGPCGYMIDGSGFVHLRGLVKNIAQVNYSTSGNIQIATGFPAPLEYVMGLGLFSDSNGHAGIARVDMSSAGVLYMAGMDFASVNGNSGFYSWMGILLPSYKTTTS